VDQVAELIACCVSNPNLSKNKVLEAIAETTVPLRPIEELLSIIPSEDGETESDAIPVEDAQPIPIPGWASKVSRREEEKKLAEKVKLEKERKRALCDKYETELSEARETEKEAKKEADIAASQKEQLEKKKKELQAQADAAVRKAQTAKALETASLNAARQGQRYATRHYQECKFQFKCYSRT
jgi:flagellar biosynthesis GTPase FlhF